MRKMDGVGKVSNNMYFRVKGDFCTLLKLSKVTDTQLNNKVLLLYLL